MNTSSKKEIRTILGIDPGTNVLGYGLIKIVGNNMHYIAMDVINLQKTSDGYAKLKRIFTEVSILIEKYKPTELSIEAPFYGKNVQSMLKLGRAQGVAIAAALSHNLEVHEYAPKKIKQSITGSGAASKEQLAKMLQSILGIKELPKYLDATDGLAAAVCHYYQNSNKTISGKSYGSWETFVSQNSNRIKPK